MSLHDRLKPYELERVNSAGPGALEVTTFGGPLRGTRWLRTRVAPGRLTAVEDGGDRDYIYVSGRLEPVPLPATDVVMHDYELFSARDVTEGRFRGKRVVGRKALYAYKGRRIVMAPPLLPE